MELLSQFKFGDTVVRYMWDPLTRQVGLLLVPESRLDQVNVNKQYAIDSLVQVKLIGDDYAGGFAQGITMRSSKSISKFKYEEQLMEQDEACCHINTIFKHELHPYMITYKLTYFHGYESFESVSTISNLSNDEIGLEMLSSFSLSGITPFEQGDAPFSLLMHRFRSKWSNEGRLETCTIEDVQLEPSWQKHGILSERFGQVGSMPVRGFFPFVAVEDTVRSVIWAAQLAHPASWQLEVYRRDDALCLSGGLADREFGHWLKKLKPNESFTTPIALLTTAVGDLDAVSQRLTRFHNRLLNNLPETEKELPIIFNEFCTTWGTPSHENISRIAHMLKGKDIQYLIIDAGWYAESGKSWESNMGDWHVSPELFPQGLEATVQEIRDCGMIPGIWFEIENCGPLAQAYTWEEHLLKRDGIPITSGQRRFWDFNDPFVIDFLESKIINFIKKFNFGYLKIDYNETIGIGCDHNDSLGEGLRVQMEAVQAFFRRIQEEFPQLVIENCSSGGHRLEPSMLGLTSMSSFSDAHEELEIPIIAANMHRVILPRQSQIWAVLRKDDTEKRLRYSITSTFLGRMCLSGDIYDLQEVQWGIVDEGIQFYKRISHLIREGVSYRFGPKVQSYRHPDGWQAIVRTSHNRNEAVVIAHTFDGVFNKPIQIPLVSKGTYYIEDVYMENSNDVSILDNELSININESFSGAAILLKLKN